MFVSCYDYIGFSGFFIYSLIFLRIMSQLQVRISSLSPPLMPIFLRTSLGITICPLAETLITSSICSVMSFQLVLQVNKFLLFLFVHPCYECGCHYGHNDCGVAFYHDAACFFVDFPPRHCFAWSCAAQAAVPLVSRCDVDDVV